MQDKTNIPEVVDLDDDGLDDRLQQGHTSTNTVSDVLNRIDELHVTNLFKDMVKKNITLTPVYMGEDNSEIEKQQAAMRKQLETLQTELSEIKSTLQKRRSKEP